MSDTTEPIDEATHRSTRRRTRWSKVFAVVGAILLPIAALSFWSRNQLLDTNHYVHTIEPVASHPAVRAALIDRVTQAVSDAVDLEDRAKDALPDRAKFLAGPIAAAGDDLIRQVATTFVTSDQFKQLWVEVNRLAHSQLVDIITGSHNSAVQTSNGEVVISLRPIVDQVVQQLDKVVPVDLSNVNTDRLNTQFVLIDSKDLGRVQSGVKWFNRLAYFLLVLAIAALVASALLPKDKRRGVQRTGFALTISMVVTLVAYRAGRSIYVSSLPSAVKSPEAAAAVFDIVTRYVERGIQALLVLGLVLFVVAWVLGPSRSAVRIRGWWQRLGNRGSESLAGVEPAPMATWVAGHTNELRFAIVGVAVAALILWDQPTGKVVLLLTVLTLLALAVVAVLAGAVRIQEAELEPREVDEHPAG